MERAEIYSKVALVAMIISFFVQCTAEQSQATASATTDNLPGPLIQLKTDNQPQPLIQLKTSGEKVVCLDFKSKCFGKILLCPKQCPLRKPLVSNAKGCFTDCSAKCETTCKNRRPNCHGFGAICYDPRFVGGDGVMFYFHGKNNKDFSMVSDKNLQINAHFIGHKPQGRSREYTWIQSLGIMFGTHTFTVGAKKVAKWDDNVDQFEFAFDSQNFSLPKGPLSVWNAPSSDLVIERTAETNSVTVSIPRALELAISVVPITEKDNRAHNYQIPPGDCFAHLEVQFKFFDLSTAVEGVLGQTYRPDFKNPAKVGVPMPIMGGEDRFGTSSLLSADCNACIFKHNSSALAESKLLKTPTSLDCTSKSGKGNGIICRR